jgi:hypothetical protein
MVFPLMKEITGVGRLLALLDTTPWCSPLRSESQDNCILYQQN